MTCFGVMRGDASVPLFPASVLVDVAVVDWHWIFVDAHAIVPPRECGTPRQNSILWDSAVPSLTASGQLHGLVLVAVRTKVLPQECRMWAFVSSGEDARHLVGEDPHGKNSG